MANDLPVYTLKVNVFEMGVLMSVIMHEEDRIKRSLDGVWKQLVDYKREVEKAHGVVKKMLPGGMIKITDADGNVVIRLPCPFEIEGN